MDEPRTPNPSDLLQVTITVAGIAVALVTIDPTGAVAPYLLMAGLLALGGQRLCAGRAVAECGADPSPPPRLAAYRS